MSEHTPTTEEVRTAWYQLTINVDSFDRWLMQVKAEAWDEGRKARPDFSEGHDDYCYGYETCYCGVYVNPYREETEPVKVLHSCHCDDFGCLGCECDPDCDDYEETE